jgi:ubiquinone/menaquinone biosynthesis C-methylase UbiE
MIHRQREPEWMDADDIDAAQLRKSLSFIRLINRLLGYTRATLFHLERFSRTWKPGERIGLIDFATGSADIPRAILKWADERGFDVRITGVDRHGATVAEAIKQGSVDPRLKIVQADVLELPFDDNSFDYALTAMFLHHLSDADAVRVLVQMNRVARRGIIAADLLRHRRALWWIKLFTVLANPMVKHDAQVSVKQAFSQKEVMRMRDEAGIGFAQYFTHFGHRFVLAGEKNAAHFTG